MKKSSKPKLGKRQRFRNFIKETFRARGKSDYKEFFTRGMRWHESMAKLEHGWMYVRVFALSFVLFAAVAFLIVFCDNGIVVPTLYLLGGAFMNLTVAVFIYELNPERNLSFLLFILILVLGAIAADFITLFGYYFLHPDNDWLSTLWTAVLEEAAKAIPAIAVILVFKKRSPMLGFIIGAAIGAGFSVTEDMGYIYAYSWGIYDMVEIAVERAWTAVCTHTLWTAVIGWAFCKFKCRPYDFRFLLVTLSSIAMHFIWDMPIEIELHVLPTILCVVAAIVFSAVVLKKERKPYRQTAFTGDVQLVIPVTEDRSRVTAKIAKRWSDSANFIAALTAVLVAITFILWCFAPVDYVDISQRFKSEEEFVAFAQGDKTYLQKWDKKFEDCIDVCKINYAVIENGEYSYAFVSVEEEDGFKYDYSFNFYKNEETGKNVSEVIGIAVWFSPTDYYHLLRVAVPEEITPEGTVYRYVTYIRASNFSYCYYNSITNEYVVILSWDEDHTAETVISVFAAGIFLLGAAAFTAFKIKSKKIRRKENVG